MNPRRRLKSLLPPHDDPESRHRPLAPGAAKRQRPQQAAAGTARLFADFLAASMTLPPERLADLE